MTRPGVRAEVAGVDHDDRVAVQQRLQLGVHPHRMQRAAVVGQFGFLGGTRRGLDGPQVGDPALVVGAPPPASADNVADRSPYSSAATVAWMRPRRLDAVGDDQLRSVLRRHRRSRAGNPSERRRPAQRRPPSTPLTAPARTPARGLPVPFRGPCRSSAPECATSRPAQQRLLRHAPPHVGARHDHRALGAGQQTARPRPVRPRRRAGPAAVGERAGSAASWASPKTWSIGKSTNATPVGAADRRPPAARRRSSPPTASADGAVAANRVSGATNGTWSISCSEP